MPDFLKLKAVVMVFIVNVLAKGLAVSLAMSFVVMALD